MWVRFPPPAHSTNEYGQESHVLKTRISDALGGKIVLSRNVTYDGLRALIMTDYTNRQTSLGDLKSTRLPRLDAVLGGSRHPGKMAAAFTSASVSAT